MLSNGDNLKNFHKEYSLLFLVLLPYVKRKVEEKITVIQIEQADGNLRKVYHNIYKLVRVNDE